MPRHPLTVSPAGPDRLAVLAPVFGRAFVDDPMMRWSMGEHPDPVEQFTRCFSLFLGEVLGMGLVTEVGARGGADGAAVWVPPGQAEAWVDHPWDHPGILALADDGGRRYEAFWEWVERHTPGEPRWHLDSVAVDPVAQGSGCGRALIAAGLDRAGADGVGAFLSTGTERNVAIYARSGFRVVEDGDAPDGGPHIWFMRWDP